MRKILFIFIFIILLISAVACKKPVKEETTKKVVAPVTDTAVDSVGNAIKNVDDIDQDLNIDELNDLDSGLSDIENI